jgi:hypothetical protein
MRQSNVLTHAAGVGLAPLNRFFEADRPLPKEQPLGTKRESEKESETREYYQKMKMWMDDEGLS